MHQHLDRHLNEIVFTKCEDRACCGEWRSEETLQHFENSQLHVNFPSPTQSKNAWDTTKHFFKGVPTKQDGPGSCQFGCKAYNFKSKTAKARHMSVFHQHQVKVAPGLTPYKCDVAGCGRVFQSLSSLNQHKTRAHTARKNRKETAGKKRASKQPI